MTGTPLRRAIRPALVLAISLGLGWLGVIPAILTLMDVRTLVLAPLGLAEYDPTHDAIYGVGPVLGLVVGAIFVLVNRALIPRDRLALWLVAAAAVALPTVGLLCGVLPARAFYP